MLHPRKRSPGAPQDKIRAVHQLTVRELPKFVEDVYLLGQWPGQAKLFGLETVGAVMILDDGLMVQAVGVHSLMVFGADESLDSPEVGVVVAMPDWPHEYTVRSWRPELDDEFTSFCQLIADTGISEPWPPPPDCPIYNHPYLVVGDYKYWTMGPSGDRHPPEDMTVINRTLLKKR